MAGSAPLGPVGTRLPHTKAPAGLCDRSFAVPGPVGMDAWCQALQDDGSRQQSITPLSRAAALVQEFAERPRGGAFTSISRRRVADGLFVRISSPTSINQGTSSLCGPATLLYDLASRDPVAYAQYVIDLYETGVGRIRKLEVEAGSDLKEFDPGRRVDASDWIALASLRDSENFFFDYQEDSDAFAGITLPGELEEWFLKAGYTEVVNDARVMVDQPEENIRRADSCFRRGYRVCLFIHSNMLSESTKSDGSTTADHWVVETSPVTFGLATIGSEQKRTISLTIYTWGEGRRPVPGAGVLPVDDFLDNYYGFVAARF